MPLLAEADLPIATLALPIEDPAEMLSPAVVKVVTDVRGDALYFSRAPIPHLRQGASTDLQAAASAAVQRGLARKHVGLYVYRREALLRFAALPPAPLEDAERLEQLRALHHGMRIRVVGSGTSGVAVDTPDDLERVRSLLAPGGAPDLSQGEEGACPPPSTSSSPVASFRPWARGWRRRPSAACSKATASRSP